MRGVPNRGDVVRNSTKFLADLGHEIQVWISDGYGEYACKMRDRISRLPFVLTARSIPTYRGVVGFQTALLDLWKGAHVLGIAAPGQDPEFFVFSGRRIQSFSGGLHHYEYKPGNEMVDVPFLWGEKWDPRCSLWALWRELKLSTPPKQQTLG